MNNNEDRSEYSVPMIGSFTEKLRFAYQAAKYRAKKRDLPGWLPEPETLEEREREAWEDITRSLESELDMEDGELQPVVDSKFSSDDEDERTLREEMN